MVLSDFWEDLDIIGSSFYMSGSKGNYSPSTTEMVNYLTPITSIGNTLRVHAETEKLILVLETGRQPFDGSNFQPWQYSTVVDYQEAVDYLEATNQIIVSSYPDLGGEYVWKFWALESQYIDAVN